MNDIDNYIYKCIFELLEVKTDLKEINEECSCKYGYKNLNS